MVLFGICINLFNALNKSTINETEPIIEEFYRYPLQAWQTTDIHGGDCEKIKYEIQKENTGLIYVQFTRWKIVSDVSYLLYRPDFNNGTLP